MVMISCRKCSDEPKEPVQWISGSSEAFAVKIGCQDVKLIGEVDNVSVGLNCLGGAAENTLGYS